MHGGVRHLPRELAAGAVVGVMGISIALSFSSLVFRGALADDFAVGVGWGLAGMAAMGMVVALASSVRGVAAGPQDVPTVVVAAVAVDLVARDTADPLATLAAFVVVSSLVSGVGLVVVGRRRLGGLVRYVPYPVVAGFLGGTGVVLSLAGLSLLVGAGPGDAPWLRLVPGIAVAVALVWLGRRRSRPALPALLLVGAVVGYHVVAWSMGIDTAVATSRGLVLGPFPPGRLLDLDTLGLLGRADWGEVLTQVPAMLVLGLLTVLALLLNVGALEQELDQDVDADRELVATGIGLLAGAPIVGLPGFVLLGDTMVGRRIGGPSRVPPFVAAGLAAIVLVIGADVLTLVPVLVTGGMLLTIGLDFMITWVWEVRRRVGVVEHLVILAIVVVVATVGFLQGVGLGILAAVAMYVVRSSRVGAVRTMSTLRVRRSRVQRDAATELQLEAVGDRAAIVELQGYLFFGTAEQAVAAILDHLGTLPQVQYLVVDLQRVTGVDSSAVGSLHRLARHTQDRGVDVVLSGGSPAVQALVVPLLGEGTFTAAPDLDRALEMGEERVLAAVPSVDAAAPYAGVDTAVDGDGTSGASSPDATRGAAVPAVWRDVAPMQLPAGHTIVRAGDRDVGLFLLTGGRAAVIIESSDEQRHALLLPGTVIGEMSLLSDRPANATVVCETDCQVRHLDADTVAHLSETDPARALDLHRFIARRLARKLAAADRTITSLQ